MTPTMKNSPKCAQITVQDTEFVIPSPGFALVISLGIPLAIVVSKPLQDV